MNTTLEQVLQAVRRFEENIECSATIPGLPNCIMEADPRLIYYVSSTSATIRGMTMTLHIRYQNTEKLAIDQMYYAESALDCARMMYSCAGDYRPYLVVYMKKTVYDAKKPTEVFSDRYLTYLSQVERLNTQLMSFEKSTYTIVEFMFKYRVGRVKLGLMQKELDREVDRVSKMLFIPGMPVEAKLLLAHNYLATHTRYVDDDSNPLTCAYTQSAYGAMIRGKCVCQGYAEAFNRLMNHEGIKCRTVGGEARAYGAGKSGKEDHAWNVVAVSPTQYAHVDVTWDENPNAAKMNWFCLSDAQMKAKNRRWSTAATPACTADGAAVLQRARAYVQAHRAALIGRGVPSAVLAGI